MCDMDVEIEFDEYKSLKMERGLPGLAVPNQNEALEPEPVFTSPSKVYLVVLYHHAMEVYGEKKVLLNIFSSRKKAENWLISEGYSLQTDVKWGKEEQDPFQVWSYVLIKEHEVK